MIHVEVGATIPYQLTYHAIGNIGTAARDAAMQSALLASDGLVNCLLFASAHEYSVSVLFNRSVACLAATAAVHLIGHNEEGLTLTRNAVNAVLDGFLMFFVLGSVEHSDREASYIIPYAETVAHMVVSDTHKTFVVQHHRA
eukprot:COSAG01_NODE_18966_length_1040_cov_0.935175_2_plen_141_part_01